MLPAIHTSPAKFPLTCHGHMAYECAPPKSSFKCLLQETQLGLQLIRLSFNNTALSGLRTTRLRRGTIETLIHLLHTWAWCHPRSGDSSIILTMIKVILPDEMEWKVYDFSDGNHEQFLARVMKSGSLIDKQVQHFDQQKKAETVLCNAIQEHDSKRKMKREGLPLLRRGQISLPWH